MKKSYAKTGMHKQKQDAEIWRTLCAATGAAQIDNFLCLPGFLLDISAKRSIMSVAKEGGDAHGKEES
jgi:hypothetical protein